MRFALELAQNLVELGLIQAEVVKSGPCPS